MVAGNGVSEDGKNDRDGRTFASALVKTLPRCGLSLTSSRPRPLAGQDRSMIVLSQERELCVNLRRDLRLGIQEDAEEVSNCREPPTLDPLTEMKPAPHPLHC
jgi:hypothetical protein